MCSEKKHMICADCIELKLFRIAISYMVENRNENLITEWELKYDEGIALNVCVFVCMCVCFKKTKKKMIKTRTQSQNQSKKKAVSLTHSDSSLGYKESNIQQSDDSIDLQTNRTETKEKKRNAYCFCCKYNSQKNTQWGDLATTKHNDNGSNALFCLLVGLLEKKTQKQNKTKQNKTTTNSKHIE